MIYNASNHTLQFDDGRLAAKLTGNVTVEQGFYFADSFSDGSYKSLYQEYFDQAKGLESEPIEKSDRLGESLNRVTALKREVKALKEELANSKEAQIA